MERPISLHRLPLQQVQGRDDDSCPAKGSKYGPDLRAYITAIFFIELRLSTEKVLRAPFKLFLECPFLAQRCTASKRRWR